MRTRKKPAPVTRPGDKMMSFVLEKARAYDPDPPHNESVTNLALSLFDGLRELHGYGSKERRLLEIAARLHDIGWSQVVLGKHHKAGARMILELDIPGMGEKDRGVVALIARYHTKALPDPSRHRRFAALSAPRRRLVEWLSGILRVADSLDASHLGIVKKLSCTMNGRVIRLRLRVSGDCRTEVAKAEAKGKLLVLKTGRKIRYLCS